MVSPGITPEKQRPPRPVLRAEGEEDREVATGLGQGERWQRQLGGGWLQPEQIEFVREWRVLH